MTKLVVRFLKRAFAFGIYFVREEIFYFGISHIMNGNRLQLIWMERSVTGRNVQGLSLLSEGQSCIDISYFNVYNDTTIDQKEYLPSPMTMTRSQLVQEQQ